jgi:adenylyltransferase/sulfurtransferase
VLAYLAGAGVGTIILCDNGTVELSNLNRQILYTTADEHRSKARQAKSRLEAMNPCITVEAVETTLTADSIASIADGADILVDCLDNFETRYVLNAYAVKQQAPFIHAGIRGFAGQLTVIDPPTTPCLRCIFPEAPPAENVPVSGVTAGIIGSLEALETVKYLLGTGTLLKGKLLLLEGETGEFHTFEVEKNPDCPVCGRPAART